MHAMLTVAYSLAREMVSGNDFIYCLLGSVCFSINTVSSASVVFAMCVGRRFDCGRFQSTWPSLRHVLLTSLVANLYAWLIVG